MLETRWMGANTNIIELYVVTFGREWIRAMKIAISSTNFGQKCDYNFVLRWFSIVKRRDLDQSFVDLHCRPVVASQPSTAFGSRVKLLTTFDFRSLVYQVSFCFLEMIKDLGVHLQRLGEIAWWRNQSSKGCHQEIVSRHAGLLYWCKAFLKKT